MNPSTNAPIYYGPSNLGSDGALLAGLANRDLYAPALDGATNSAIGCARDQIGDLKGLVKDVGANVREAVKDSESNIRSDVRQEGQEAVAATKDAECRIMDKVSAAECNITKEVMENKFALTKEILENKYALATAIQRSEYENKLAIQTAIKEINDKAQYNTDRTQDKIASGFKEVGMELCEFRREQAVCCCEVKSALSLLTGGVLPAHK